MAEGNRDIRRVPVDDVMRIFIAKPGFLLARVDQIANALYAKLTEGAETLAQAELLLAIAAQGECGDQAGLARACGSDTSTTAIILDNLEVAGLIVRQQDSRDRRRSIPLLTAAGSARMTSVRAAFGALQIELLRDFDAKQRDVFIGLIGAIARGTDHAAPRWEAESSPFLKEPSFLCRRALQICQAQFSACVAPLSLTLRQFSALVILHLHPGLSQVDFARVFGLDPSTCAVVLKKLATRGLLEAARAPDDRRKTLYFTTRDGSGQAASVQPAADRSEQLTFSPLALDEADLLLRMLQAIVRRHAARLRYPGCLPWDDETSEVHVD
ncbi:MarR family transcriptional regulator [Sphingobium nicotianae]|uniref:MarR family transcriptional regulator n=1 Tax=Sphingobium nicotianae TaxID=2782607 RepID=A0A9X1IRE3_9SPHN|nr:MarR family transcriptional regulator [Sphingobium nicotianae]MBT2187393.1 MarR family transcriptional regulator [Sphingobium nicotianae]